MGKYFQKNGNKLFIRMTVAAVMCLFYLNTISWALPRDLSFRLTSNTNEMLQVQSIFSPILKEIGWRYKVRLEAEMCHILAMAFKDEESLFPGMNGLLDEWYTEHTDGVTRLLNVVSHPQKTDDSFTIEIEILHPSGHKGKRFRIVSTCESMEDILEDLFNERRKTTIESMPRTTDEKPSKNATASTEKWQNVLKLWKDNDKNGLINVLENSGDRECLWLALKGMGETYKRTNNEEIIFLIERFESGEDQDLKWAAEEAIIKIRGQSALEVLRKKGVSVETSNLERKLQKGEMVITVEPHSKVIKDLSNEGEVNAAKLSFARQIDFLRKIYDFDGYNLLDGPGGKQTLPPIELARLMTRGWWMPEEDFIYVGGGYDAQFIFQAVTRSKGDRAKLADYLWKIFLVGRGKFPVVALKGDPILPVDKPWVKTLPLLELINDRLKKGIKPLSDDKSDAEVLPFKPDYFTGAVTGLPKTSEGIDAKIRYCEKKIRAGAVFFQTQPVFDMEVFKEFLTAFEEMLERLKIEGVPNAEKVRLIPSVMVLRSLKAADYMNEKISGVNIPVEILNRLKDKKDSNILKEGIEIAAETAGELKRLFEDHKIRMKKKNFLGGMHFMPLRNIETMPIVLYKAGLIGLEKARPLLRDISDTDKSKFAPIALELLKDIDEEESVRDEDADENDIAAAEIKKMKEKIKKLDDRSLQLFYMVKRDLIAALKVMETGDKAVPVDIVIDLSLISPDEREVENNVRTLAHLILLCKDIKNVNFVFERRSKLIGENTLPAGLEQLIGDAPDLENVMSLLRTEIKNNAVFFDSGDELKELINKRIREIRSEAAPNGERPVEIPITSKAILEWMRDNKIELANNQYPVALEGLDTGKNNEVLLQNFEAAFTVGLAKASLVLGKRQVDRNKDGAEAEFLELKTRLIIKLNNLYSVITGNKMFNEKVVDYMISTESVQRIGRAIDLYLPIITRMAIDELKELHEHIQGMLRSA